jgi:hypothetical protein
MITISNIKRHEDMPFGDYLQMPGYSHSWLKNEEYGFQKEFTETNKIKIGKIADGILMSPNDVDMTEPLYETGRIVALSIRDSNIGQFIKMFKAQVSYTADLEYEGLVMPVKVRLDWELPGYMVLDLKVTQVKDMHSNIAYMGYLNQTWLQAKCAQVPQRYIVAQYCGQLPSGEVIPRGPADIIRLPKMEDYNDFWAASIMKFGTVREEIV